MLYDLAIAWINLCAQVEGPLYLWVLTSPVWVPLWAAIGLALYLERRP